MAALNGPAAQQADDSRLESEDAANSSDLPELERPIVGREGSPSVLVQVSGLAPGESAQPDAGLPKAGPAAAARRQGPGDDSLETLEIDLLLQAVLQRFGYDFRDYARGPLRRRLHALMASLDLPTVSRLQDRVLHGSDEARALLVQLGRRDSRLFESPAAYAQLRDAIDLALCGTPLARVWLADCAGLAEAWSTAILLHEAGLLGRAEIYATVACDDVLASLHEGGLPAAELEASRHVYLNSGGCARLEDYFEVADGLAVLAAPLRSRITWAQYSLVTDASFNEFELIVCRHALADFNPRLRRRTLRLFHDSLARFGVLGLDRPIDPESGIARHYQPLQPGAFWYRRVA